MPASLRPIDKPLAWVGDDRLLLNDKTIYGLRRKVLARKGEIPNMVGLLEVAYREAGNARVHHWLFERDEFYLLWIVWKEG